MPSVYAHSTHGPDVQHIFDDIHRQFQLSPEAMVGLTGAFLNEFKVGLGEYNHPMAMMCVGYATLDQFLNVLQPYICYRRSGWY